MKQYIYITRKSIITKSLTDDNILIIEEYDEYIKGAFPHQRRAFFADYIFITNDNKLKTIKSHDPETPPGSIIDTQFYRRKFNLGGVTEKCPKYLK